jgi:hypothetical protein
MTEQDIKNKNLVVITYLDSIINDYKVKAEFSTNDNDIKVIVCQEESGQKIVFYDEENPLFNYYTINTYGDNIKEEKETSVVLGNLIGKSVLLNYEVKHKNKPTEVQKWQIIFMQMSNPRAIQYMDIRRVGYTMSLKCIVNRVA